MIYRLLKRIGEINWDEYSGPALYSPERLVDAFSKLISLTDKKEANAVGDEMLNAIGNNHAGTYYPAVLEGLDILLDMEKYDENKVRSICIRSLLNDIYYFEPEIGSYKGISEEALREFVTDKLANYSDEFFN